MTRSPRDQVQVKAGSDVYTALTGVALVVVFLGIVALWLASSTNFGENPFMPSGNTAMR